MIIESMTTSTKLKDQFESTLCNKLITVTQVKQKVNKILQASSTRLSFYHQDTKSFTEDFCSTSHSFRLLR